MPFLRFPLFPIAFLTAIFYLNFGSRILLGPFLPVIERELGLGHGGAGSLFLFIQIGYASGLLGSGFVSWRLTHRRTVVLSSIGVGLAMIALSRATSLVEMYLWLVMVGLTAGLYLPTGIATITELVEEPHWGKAMAVHELAPSLAYITAPLLAEALLTVTSWRNVLAIVGGGAVVLGVCFRFWGQGGTRQGDAPRLETVRRLVREPGLWVMACLFAMGVGASLGVYTMLPLFLVSEIGLGRAAANTVTGLSRLSSLAMTLVSGWLTDRVGHRRALTLSLVATGVITLGLGLLTGPVVTPLLVFCQAAAAVLFFPPAFAAISRLFPAQMRNLAISLSGMVATAVGAGLLPSAIGYLAEAASFSLAFVLVGVAAIFSPLLLRLGARSGDARPPQGRP
jgi:NNP family nitrate/nitrite transporter-like MFS transporter